MKTRLNNTPCAHPRRVTKSPRQTARRRRPIRLAKILVPIDFSKGSRKALQYAVPLARHFGANITLLHIVEPIVYPMDYGYGTVNREIPNATLLKQSRTKLNSLGKKVVGPRRLDEALVRTGAADVEIVEVAKAREIDLILLGRRGCGEGNHLATGSTAEKVARHAPCPVLVVRQKEHEFVESWRGGGETQKPYQETASFCQKRWGRRVTPK
jgi:nucleotide-binding universal stress UspA family protein